jgi:hypothetical protein
MKKSIAMMAAMMMAAASNPHFSLETPKRQLSEDEKRDRAHRLNPVDMSQREFIIKGEKIMAHDKKTALKIYARRHSKKK